ncbi:branched-chain amino acid ABC transporter substrate-binding protein, partial [Nocardioides sp.]|uniref:branched-chain amino acid ABC transporter substrate-binding protein n=1 Tax=Nocardioides sp. TaxID=35761 RepID=UPI0027328BD1
MRIGHSARAKAWVGLVVVGALALAGCGGNDASGGDGDGGTLKIAYQGPLSGDNAQLGINMDNAAKLAVEQANESGDLPFKLEYTNVDDVGDPAQAPAATQKLVDDSDVIAVAGPAFSGATKASGPIFTQANLAAVSPSATNAELTQLGFSTFFRVVPADNVQGEKAAAYIESLSQNKHLYLVDDKSEYGVGLADVIEDALADTDVKVDREGVAPTKDYSAVATKIANSGADTVYYAGYFAEGALFARALDATTFEGNRLAGDGSNDDQFIAGAGDAAEGWQMTCACADARIDPSAKSFVDAYTEAYGEAPGAYSAEAYDATNTIISVLRGLDDPARESVVEGLRGVQYKGLVGDISFTEDGEPTAGSI